VSINHSGFKTRKPPPSHLVLERVHRFVGMGVAGRVGSRGKKKKGDFCVFRALAVPQVGCRGLVAFRGAGGCPAFGEMLRARRGGPGEGRALGPPGGGCPGLGGAMGSGPAPGGGGGGGGGGAEPAPGAVPGLRSHIPHRRNRDPRIARPAARDVVGRAGVGPVPEEPAAHPHLLERLLQLRALHRVPGAHAAGPALPDPELPLPDHLGLLLAAVLPPARQLPRRGLQEDVRRLANSSQPPCFPPGLGVGSGRTPPGLRLPPTFGFAWRRWDAAVCVSGGLRAWPRGSAALSRRGGGFPGGAGWEPLCGLLLLFRAVPYPWRGAASSPGARDSDRLEREVTARTSWRVFSLT